MDGRAGSALASKRLGPRRRCGDVAAYRLAQPLLSAARGEAAQYGSQAAQYGSSSQAAPAEATPAGESPAGTAAVCQRLLLMDGRGSAQSGDSSSPLLAGGGNGRQNRGSSAFSSSSRSEESGGGGAGIDVSGDNPEGRSAFSASCFPMRRSTRVGWQKSISRDKEADQASSST